MIKKMLLAGAVLLAGSLFTSQKADAQFGVVRYGAPVVRGPVVRGPMVRGFNPYVGQRYGAYRYGYQPGFRGGAWGAPYYRSYMGPMGVGPRGFVGPMYGPGFGRSGFSMSIGPMYRGW
jgi:hypothetical protein